MRRLEITRAAPIVESEGVDELIVGLPLEASGAEGPQAEKTRAWVAAVVDRIGRPVILRDERLSSHLAETRLGPMPRGRSGGPPTRTQRDAYRARVDLTIANAVEIESPAPSGSGTP